MGAGSFLFGGKPQFMHESKFEEDYKKGAKEGIASRLGAKPLGGGQYDWSGVGAPVGKKEAIAGYDFSPMSESIETFKKPTLFSQKYNPYQFSFQSLPEQYAREQYDLGSRDIRREGQSSLRQMQEALGPRNRGLLLKAAQGSQRGMMEQLGGLNLGIRGKMMEEKARMAKEQQLAQAGENLAAFGAEKDVAAMNADERYRYAEALAATGDQRLAREMAITQSERDYRDRGLEYLLDMYKTFLTSRRGVGNVAKSGIAGGLLGAGAQVGSAAIGAPKA